MLVPLFTSAKRQAMGSAYHHADRRISQAPFQSQVHWKPAAAAVVLESQGCWDKAREEVRGHVAALMKCEAKYQQEKGARESVEAKMRAQAAYNSGVVTGLEEQLGYADDRLRTTQLDLETAEEDLARERAKRRTLEFSHEVLTAKYGALVAARDALENDRLGLARALERSEAEQAETAAQLADSVREAEAVRVHLAEAHASRDRVHAELEATHSALRELRNLHAAADSSTAVLQQQVSTLLVTVSALRSERDELREALATARREAAVAKAEASAARAHLQEEQKRTRALETQLAEKDTLLAAAQRKAVDADWTARDEFAKPKMAFAYTVVDVDLFEAQMERDLYKSQYEEEAEARESAEKERDEALVQLEAAMQELERFRTERIEQEQERNEGLAQLEAALEELERCKAERKEQEQENQDLRQQLRAAADTHADELKKVEGRLNEIASDMEGLQMKLEETEMERRRNEEMRDAKENEVPALDMQRYSNLSRPRSDKRFEAKHQTSPFAFSVSDILFRSSPVLPSQSLQEKNGNVVELDLQETRDHPPLDPVPRNLSSEAPDMFRQDNTVPSGLSSPVWKASSMPDWFRPPTLFQQQDAPENTRYSSRFEDINDISGVFV